jgi:hypothetical protein
MGEKCHFAHGRDQLRQIHEPLPDSCSYVVDKHLSLLSSLGINYIPSPELVKKYLRENALTKLDNGKSREEVESQSEELLSSIYQAVTQMQPEHYSFLLLQDPYVQCHVTTKQLEYIITNLE